MERTVPLAAFTGPEGFGLCVTLERSSVSLGCWQWPWLDWLSLRRRPRRRRFRLGLAWVDIPTLLLHVLMVTTDTRPTPALRMATTVPTGLAVASSSVPVHGSVAVMAATTVAVMVTAVMDTVALTAIAAAMAIVVDTLAATAVAMRVELAADTEADALLPAAVEVSTVVVELVAAAVAGKSPQKLKELKAKRLP